MNPSDAEQLEGSSDRLAAVIGQWRNIWASDRSVEMPVLDGTISSGFLHLAWAHHAVRLSESVLALYERSMHLQAVPLIRQTLETAISTIWATRVPEAGDRAYVAHVLARRTMLREMKDLGYFVGDGIEELEQELAALETKHGNLDTFKMPPLGNRARAFKGGPDLYPHYRSLSQFSHPTFWLADAYAHSTDDEANPIALSDSARYDQSLLAMNYQLVATCHTLGVWSTLPHQSSRYTDFMDQLDAVGAGYRFKVARHPGVLAS